MVSPVIDLSHHNPDPDWAAVKKAGVAGVIHKATEGSTYRDPELYGRAVGATSAGLLWGTYHFMRPGNMRLQMEHYIDVVDPVPGERMALDHEDPRVSLADLELAVANLWSLRPDLKVTIYGGDLLKVQLGDRRSEILAKTSLWIAQHTRAARPSWPRGTWPDWSLWQWTDSETVPGIPAPVDGDRWNGTSEALEAWLSPGPGEPLVA